MTHWIMNESLLEVNQSTGNFFRMICMVWKKNFFFAIRYLNQRPLRLLLCPIMITPTVFDLKVSYLHIVWSLLVSYTTHAHGVSCGWDTSRKNWLKKEKTRPIQDIKSQLQIWNLVYFFGSNITATTRRMFITQIEIYVI